MSSCGQWGSGCAPCPPHVPCGTYSPVFTHKNICVYFTHTKKKFWFWFCFEAGSHGACAGLELPMQLRTPRPDPPLTAVYHHPQSLCHAGDWTHGSVLARQMLYKLSHIPSPQPTTAYYTEMCIFISSVCRVPMRWVLRLSAVDQSLAAAWCRLRCVSAVIAVSESKCSRNNCNDALCEYSRVSLTLI